ncbi:MAG: nucleoside deaminase, partial [Chloroflexota bacterium]
MHETYMQRCIELAKEAKAKGDVPVGSLVLQGETIVAEAYEIVPSTRTVTGYAEIIAVQKACDALGTMNLQDCTLYTTAEPCWMCTYAIRETGIAQVVIGSKTLDVGAISTKYKLLTDDTITVWGAPPTIV